MLVMNFLPAGDVTAWPGGRHHQSTTNTKTTSTGETTTMSDMKLELNDNETAEVTMLYGKLGDQHAYKHLPMMVKRTAASIAIGVVKHWTPDQVNEWATESEDFRLTVDALIEAYEESHPDKINHEERAAMFIAEMALGLDHSQCDHSQLDEDDDHHHHASFRDTSKRMKIDDADVDAKFSDIMAGFEVSDVKRPSFEVGTDGETTDQRGQEA